MLRAASLLRSDCLLSVGWLFIFPPAFVFFIFFLDKVKRAGVLSRKRVLSLQNLHRYNVALC